MFDPGPLVGVTEDYDGLLRMPSERRHVLVPEVRNACHEEVDRGATGRRWRRIEAGVLQGLGELRGFVFQFCGAQPRRRPDEHADAIRTSKPSSRLSQRSVRKFRILLQMRRPQRECALPAGLAYPVYHTRARGECRILRGELLRVVDYDGVKLAPGPGDSQDVIDAASPDDCGRPRVVSLALREADDIQEQIKNGSVVPRRTSR